MLVLDTHDTTSPGSSKGFVVVELSLELLGEGLKIGEVFTANFGEGNTGSSLGVDELTEGSLSADETEGDSLLSAESGEEDNKLDWVNIVSNHNELSFLLLNKSGDVVKTKLEVNWLLSFLVLTGLSLRLKTKFLLLLVLGRVFSEELEKVGSYKMI